MLRLLTLVLVLVCGDIFASGGKGSGSGKVQSFQSKPNVFKGYNYYNAGRPMGQSRPNIYGGQNYNSYNRTKK